MNNNTEIQNSINRSPDLPDAGYTDRCVAALIDMALISMGSFICGIGSYFTIGWILNFIPIIGPILNTLISGLFGFIFPIIYNAVFEGGKLGSSPGKIFCGLAVRHSSGRKLTLSEGALRGLGKIISSSLFCLGYLLAFFRNDRKALHDFFADSIVIRKGPGHDKLKGVIHSVEDKIQDSFKELEEDLKQYTDD